MHTKPLCHLHIQLTTLFSPSTSTCYFSSFPWNNSTHPNPAPTWTHRDLKPCQGSYFIHVYSNSPSNNIPTCARMKARLTELRIVQPDVHFGYTVVWRDLCSTRDGGNEQVRISDQLTSPTLLPLVPKINLLFFLPQFNL